MLKIAVVAPTVSATVTIAPTVNVGVLRRARKLWRTSRKRFNTRLTIDSSWPSEYSVDAHTVVVVDGAAAHVRVALVHGSVDCRSLFRPARPTAFGAGDYARPDSITDVSDRKESTSGVRDSHLVSCRNLPGGGIVGMDQQRCGSRSPLLPRHVGENRIQEVVIGGRYQTEWVLAGQGRIVLRRLVRGRVAGDGIQSCKGHSLGDEFQLARRGRKSVSERY